jgi:mannose-6-phosphate isomerase
MTPLYPLRFKEILRNYSFGDRWIVEAFEKAGLPEDHRIAETWEVCDRPGESSVVTNGPLRGETLHTLIERYGVRLLGQDVVARRGTRFPLLIKFLDASHTLAEQAHHSDVLARARGLDDPGKTEAWYMLRVRQGATIRCGQRPGMTANRVREALQAGTIRDAMQTYAVAPGDAFLLYAGTMHYTQGGVLFYEIMQNSDVYIGLEPPSPELSEDAQEAKLQAMMEGLHLERGFQCQTRPITVPAGDDDAGNNQRTFVLACTHFALERLDLTTPHTLKSDGARFVVLSQIEGAATVAGGDQRETLLPGHSCLLPAALETVTVTPQGPCALLKAYVPDLAEDVIRPLRQAGVPDPRIAQLGGQTRLNPLIPLLGQGLQ